MRIFVSVPQDYDDVLKPGLTATLTLPQDPNNPIPVQFLTTANAVTPATRTVITEFTVDNTDGKLWPGTYANVHLTFPSDPNILILPEQALMFRAQGMQVAVLDGQNRVHLQNVALGHNLDTEVQIISGLKATDRVVASPSAGLLDGPASEDRATDRGLSVGSRRPGCFQGSDYRVHARCLGAVDVGPASTDATAGAKNRAKPSRSDLQRGCGRARGRVQARCRNGPVKSSGLGLVAWRSACLTLVTTVALCGCDLAPHIPAAALHPAGQLSGLRAVHRGPSAGRRLTRPMVGGVQRPASQPA